MEEALGRARGLLASACRILVLTGAGLSREAGLPTFRDANGVWGKLRPEDLATPEAFARNPEKVWEWYRLRMEAARQACPHAGHEALARLALRKGPGLLVLNQNVDGLLERACTECGAGLAQVLAIHGNLSRAHCQRCGKSVATVELEPETLPTCACGGRLRPSVVWFGESLSPLHLHRMEAWSQEMDLLMAVGTSALVWPAAGLLPLARRRGVPVVVVNPLPQGVVAGDVWIGEGALRALPALVEEL